MFNRGGTTNLKDENSLDELDEEEKQKLSNLPTTYSILDTYMSNAKNKAEKSGKEAVAALKKKRIEEGKNAEHFSDEEDADGYTNSKLSLESSTKTDQSADLSDDDDSDDDDDQDDDDDDNEFSGASGSGSEVDRSLSIGGPESGSDDQRNQINRKNSKLSRNYSKSRRRHQSFEELDSDDDGAEIDLEKLKRKKKKEADKAAGIEPEVAGNSIQAALNKRLGKGPTKVQDSSEEEEKPEVIREEEEEEENEEEQEEDEEQQDEDEEEEQEEEQDEEDEEQDEDEEEQEEDDEEEQDEDEEEDEELEEDEEELEEDEEQDEEGEFDETETDLER